jgi:hypothetical protein
MSVADPADGVLTDAGMFVDLRKVILVFDRGYWKISSGTYCKWCQVHIRTCLHVL